MPPDTPVDAGERHANATFEALMWAAARPGSPRQLPSPGVEGIVDTLLDRECRFFAEDASVARHAADTGAHAVPLRDADYVFMTALSDPSALLRVRAGSDLYPDEGATLFLSARFGDGPTQRFSGPGVDGALGVMLDGLPRGFWRQRADAIRYPMGFDLFLVDGDQVIAAPRSTHVEGD